MRITKAQARKNHEEIVKAAAGLFRKRGFDGISVADLMSSAGFTHGGFYNHFDSKDALAVEATNYAFRECSEVRARVGDLAEMLRLYLSYAHVVARDQGCPAAALGGDAARQSEQVKLAFSLGIEGMIRDLEEVLEDATPDPVERRRSVINLLAKAVGAIVLSRSVPATDRLSHEILSTCLAGSLHDLGISGTAF